jgi:DNA polymerase-3 subunit epsilon
MRLAQQVRRVEWRATGGELGARLAEAQWIEQLRPGHNRVPRAAKSDPMNAPWPFEGPIVFEECEQASQARVFHVVDRWRYLGHAASLAQAAQLHASSGDGAFELSTYRILQSHLARGLRVLPLHLSSDAPLPTLADEPVHD